MRTFFFLSSSAGKTSLNITSSVVVSLGLTSVFLGVGARIGEGFAIDVEAFGARSVKSFISDANSSSCQDVSKDE